MEIIVIVGVVGVLFLIVRIAFIARDRGLIESVTDVSRGEWSERDLVLQLLKNGIPKTAIFHDVYVQKRNGGFSQIDVVVATKVGMIGFEVKDYSGWIFGNGNQRQWTQVLAYGKERYRFYNPIMQNYWHIAKLRKRLRQFEDIPFFSVIVFYGDCELREISFVPQGTFVTTADRVLEVVNAILAQNKLANYTDKWEVVNILKTDMRNGENSEVIASHIEDIKDRLGKDRVFR